MMTQLFDEEEIRKRYDIAERKRAREEGRAEGKAEGETLLGKLIERLLGLGRTEDVLRASTDSEYRQKLYLEFGLV